MSTGEARMHNQQGMEYFRKGFHDHAPREQVADAERNYRLAVKELESRFRKISPLRRPIGTWRACTTFRKTSKVPLRSTQGLPSLPRATWMRT